MTTNGAFNDHPTDTCGLCQRDRASGQISIHYWEPSEDDLATLVAELARYNTQHERGIVPAGFHGPLVAELVRAAVRRWAR